MLKDVEATLRAGNRVWIVGQLPERTANDSVLIRPPAAPYGPRKWDDQPYTHFWGLEVREFLEAHITNAVLVIDPATNEPAINPAERMDTTVTTPEITTPRRTTLTGREPNSLIFASFNDAGC